ncbi:MAG: hypothetical protein Q8K23_18720 [Sulfuritalea sp.]|nr:hypothetical protein [Sulfuritalea sp.]
MTSSVFTSLAFAGRARLVGAALVLVPHVVLAQAGQERLGTLLFSPAERSTIAAARRDEQGQAVGSGTSVALSGLVKRGRDKGTVWINGQAVAEGQAVPAAGIPVIESKQVVIDGRPVRVRETLDLESGARTDALPQGAVSVRRQK